MQLSKKSIEAVRQVVTGDENISPYRSGPKLVTLFNSYGYQNEYAQGFPSRWVFAQQKLEDMNGTDAMSAIICEVCDPREYMDTDFDVMTAVEYINRRLSYDGYEITVDKGLARIRQLHGGDVAVSHPFKGSTEQNHRFIEEQIEKSERKIKDGDYDGAITNARSLLEAVLREIESRLDESPPKYDGDLLKLYKRVQAALNLSPGRKDIDQPLKQVLSGMTSIVQGLSGLSNRMGDRHVRTYKPSRHHALLVVNAAKSLTNFVFDTYEYQTEKSRE